ncbi:hypothetical protein V6C03_14370 [Methyloligella sp. 2.7D]|uniref:hypothetical protein n=1 Tax=unclassified Methyloligella TaxID=2625955 RepID=UPI00157C53CC|nr:hypothetical protein [Methyloligella sp. GL2]QKP77061.1 hypothetical protein HT051_06095 [Methyloligella sp. GL2]
MRLNLIPAVLLSSAIALGGLAAALPASAAQSGTAVYSKQELRQAKKAQRAKKRTLRAQRRQQRQAEFAKQAAKDPDRWERPGIGPFDDSTYWGPGWGPGFGVGTYWGPGYGPIWAPYGTYDPFFGPVGW